MVCRLIAPKWLTKEDPSLENALEGEFTPEQLQGLNSIGYNVYTFPNHPKEYLGGNVNGTHIDVFEWIFVDMDLKDGTYATKEEFLVEVESKCPFATKIIDSGNGVHVYWKITDLDAKSYLRFQRRLLRLLSTDPAVSKICQLMRLEGTVNTKDPDAFKLCRLVAENPYVTYTCEEMDKLLPVITAEDEQYCNDHYNKTHKIAEQMPISGELPPKFGILLRKNKEFKSLFSDPTDDRSKNDYRLGHIMLGNGFTRDEAMNVLFNSAKAMQRAPTHRYNYAQNIVDKIWTFDETIDLQNESPTVGEILSQGDAKIKGTRFPCHRLLDDTKHGFRLGHVIGIIGGSGVGKTTLTLNCFLWFAENNPNYHHFFFSLEQPSGEIASRIKLICGDNTTLYDKIHIVSNHNPDGTYNHFSLTDVEDHILAFKKKTGFEVGATVIDHIGVLSRETKNGETDGLIGICREMKGVAVRLNTILIMLSQAPRENAGIGDLELNKDAAYGTVFFESFVDYCLCLWQPLKRAYTQEAPTVMSFKFAKIRHKNQKQDVIKEDTCYQLFFDPETERLRELTQEEETSARYWTGIATNLRKKDKKTDIVTYVSRRLDESTTTDSDKNTRGH